MVTVFNPRTILSTLTLILLIGCGSATNTQQGGMGGPGGDKDAKKSIKPYDKVITKEAVSDTGLFTVHRIDDKFFFEISNTILGEEFLLVTRIAKTPQVGYGGEESNTSVVRWERKYDRILLRTVSYENVAPDSMPISRAVKASNFEEIVKAFSIQAFNQDTSTVVIEVTDLFTTDVPMLTPNKGIKTQLKTSSLDKERSYIEYARSFPTNVEIENVITYSADAPLQNRDSKTATFTMHHSMVQLPAVPMTPRLADPRVGFFSLRQTDYGRPEPEAVSREYILRWRLEPKDTAAFLRGELVEPIKPITWYLDPATPVQWREWLRKGVEDWNWAFNAAGFKNAIRCLDAPTPEQDSEWSPEDARYSVLRYYPSPIENAYGPNIHDPRTGEIIESDIGWFHNILKLQTGWFFAQAVSDPRSRKLPYSDSLMGRLVQTVASHEIGHTLGFPHNMAASSAYPVDSLRSKTFCAQFGTAPSIMDYARYNYIAQPGDDVDVMPKIGPYDIFATRWGYRPIIEAKTADAEVPTLLTWAAPSEEIKMMRFGDQQWVTVDPSSQMEDLGDDALKAGEYGIANLKRAMGYLYDAAYQEGHDFSLLDDSYDDILNQWRREMGHVANIPGGVIIDLKVYGSKGNQYTPVTKERQKAAVNFIVQHVFTTPTWLLDEKVMSLLEPYGSVKRISDAQSSLLGTLISNDKLIRMMDQDVRFGSKAYTVNELFNDVENSIFSDVLVKTPSDFYKRSLQRSYVSKLIEKTEKPAEISTGGFFSFMQRAYDVYNTDARAIARAHLSALGKKLTSAASADPIVKAHYEDLSLQIERALNPIR
ncbi:MAG: zinc-dependent metalloprotease [Ignavibacteria bacterium]|nr:zinc-dependent metalloprotease [Ignavibacteria bacterium]